MTDFVFGFLVATALWTIRNLFLIRTRRKITQQVREAIDQSIATLAAISDQIKQTNDQIKKIRDRSGKNETG